MIDKADEVAYKEEKLQIFEQDCENCKWYIYESLAVLFDYGY